MLKEKLDFKKGDKVIAIGRQDSVFFSCRVGIVLADRTMMSPSVPVEFGYHNRNFHSCDNRGQKDRCYTIYNLMRRHITNRAVSLYEYDEEELKYFTDVVIPNRVHIDKIDDFVTINCGNNICKTCPLNFLRGSNRCIGIDILYSQDIIYNSFVNAYKKIPENR